MKLPSSVVTYFRRVWVRSIWTKKALDQKSIEFYIPTKGSVLHGMGTLLVSEKPSGRICVEIVTQIKNQNWIEHVQGRYYLSKTAVDLIRRHPHPKTAEFLLGSADSNQRLASP